MLFIRLWWVRQRFPRGRVSLEGYKAKLLRRPAARMMHRVLVVRYIVVSVLRLVLVDCLLNLLTKLLHWNRGLQALWRRRYAGSFLTCTSPRHYLVHGPLCSTVLGFRACNTLRTLGIRGV